MFKLVFSDKLVELVKEKNSCTFHQTHFTKKYNSIKRTVDLLLATLGLIFLSPLLLILSILIYFDSYKDPILFVQERVGKDGKIFKMFKFRTMVANAEQLLPDLLDKNEMKGPMFKIKDDPRITRIGKVLRKTSLDELPQLYNVIKGDMSLVGPRPPLVSEVIQYTEFDLQRLSIVPGCTGIWQISGRNNIDFETMVKLDLWYKNNSSFFLDILIIIKTIFLIILPKKSNGR